MPWDSAPAGRVIAKALQNLGFLFYQDMQGALE